MKFIPYLCLLIMISAPAYAEEKGYTGMTLEVAVDGFFSPEIASAKIIAVAKDSPAEAAGINIGDALVSIEQCKIPGCPANKGKKLMSKPKGQLLPLTFQKEDGTEYSVELLVE